jgi:hypothetical protein
MSQGNKDMSMEELRKHLEELQLEIKTKDQELQDLKGGKQEEKKFIVNRPNRTSSVASPRK